MRSPAAGDHDHDRAIGRFEQRRHRHLRTGRECGDNLITYPDNKVSLNVASDGAPSISLAPQ
jgi:hypothetical protein